MYELVGVREHLKLNCIESPSPTKQTSKNEKCAFKNCLNALPLLKVKKCLITSIHAQRKHMDKTSLVFIKLKFSSLNVHSIMFNNFFRFPFSLFFVNIESIANGLLPHTLQQIFVTALSHFEMNIEFNYYLD